MSEFVKMLLALSLSGTLLLSATLILKKFYKNLFSRCWQYYILLLVAARFLLPVVFDYNITGYLYGMAVNAWQDNMPDESVTDVKSTANIKEAKGTKKVNETKEIKKVNEIKEIQPDIKNRIKQDIKNTAKNIPFYSYLLNGIKGIYKYCFYIWLIPAVVLIVRKISVYRGFINYIRATGTLVQDIAVLNLLAECGEKSGIKKQWNYIAVRRFLHLYWLDFSVRILLYLQNIWKMKNFFMYFYMNLCIINAGIFFINGLYRQLSVYTGLIRLHACLEKK